MVIYEAINKINNKRYIGQTKDFLRRKKQHEKSIRYGSGCTYFARALSKYGINNFVWKVIDHASTQEELDAKESFWIEFFNTTDNRYGYNLKGGGYNPFLTDEVKESIGKAQLGELNHMYGKTGSNNPTSKKVIDITTNTTYDSVSDLCRGMGFELSKVCCVCRGERLTHKGHIFRYLDDEGNIIDNGKTTSIAEIKNYKSKLYAKTNSIKILDKTNNIVYNSLIDAVGRRYISNLSRKLRQCGGKCRYHNIDWEIIG